MVEGTITVEGEDVKRRQDAINALQTMLNDYDDMNEDNTSVVIHWDSVSEES